jgi:hypothetical protein
MPLWRIPAMWGMVIANLLGVCVGKWRSGVPVPGRCAHHAPVRDGFQLMRAKFVWRCPQRCPR